MKVNQEKETAEVLELQNKRLSYDKDTGSLVWKYGRNKGKVQGTKDGGYIRVTLQSRDYYQHRVAWAIYYGYWPTKIIDHRDRNKSNNRIDNLREVSEQKNITNVGLRSTNTSGVKGVSWSKAMGKYRQDICVNYKLINLGFFNTIEEAIQARSKAELEYFK